jgi:hypothetical protein
MREHWTEDADTLFRQLWAEGVSVSEIAMRLGRSKTAIMQRRLIFNLPPRRDMKPEQRSKDKRKEGKRPRRKVAPLVRLLNPNKRGYFDSAAVLDHILNAKRRAA